MWKAFWFCVFWGLRSANVWKAKTGWVVGKTWAMEHTPTEICFKKRPWNTHQLISLISWLQPHELRFKHANILLLSPLSFSPQKYWSLYNLKSSYQSLTITYPTAISDHQETHCMLLRSCLIFAITWHLRHLLILKNWPLCSTQNINVTSHDFFVIVVAHHRLLLDVIYAA